VQSDKVAAFASLIRAVLLVRVYLCLTQEHDLQLVALAAVLCMFGASTAMSLVQRARAAEEIARQAWLATGAIATGGSIWATHFVAMLAYAPGVPMGFDLGITGLSIVVAIAVSWMGFSVAVAARRPAGWRLGGGILGAGIAAMHYTGMAALKVPGFISYDPFLWGLSLLLGIGFGSLALPVALRHQTLPRRGLAALLLTLGICAMHFTAMGALELTPSPLVPVPDNTVDSSATLAMAIAGVTVLLLSFSFGSSVGQHLTEQSAREARRLQELVNATFEGLAIHADGRLLDANAALAQLVRRPLPDIIGCDLASLIVPEDRGWAVPQMTGGVPSSHEIRLLRSDGTHVPVEILVRHMDYKGRQAYVTALRDMTERKQAEAQIRFLANHDALTELPNRVLFHDRLEHALALARRSKEEVAVLCLDLDRFKEVNDLRGHSVGDALLKQVALRLCAAVREADTVARLGGDEFAIVQPGLIQPRSAARVAERLVEAIAEPFYGSGEELVVGLSVGIAVFPADGGDAETLLKNADTALYRAKTDGRGIYRMFELEMDAKLRARRALEYDLRQALAQQQLEIHYQPQAETDSGQIIGFEALARWRHPRYGAVSPAEFIPIAEETGLIVSLGEWVLRTACAAAASWPKHIRVCVNLSPVQFGRCDLPTLVEDVLRTSGLPAERLELEITEGVLIRETQQALEVLQRLKALGVRIAMDDFGTGYSSLNCLQRFPFDKIKIDQSFVRDLKHNADSAAIVRAVIGLGRSLKMAVIAEGVETVEQRDMLRREDCCEIQGYLIGRPMPLETFDSILAPAMPAPNDADERALSAGFVLAQSGN